MKLLTEKVGMFYVEEKDYGDFDGDFYRVRVILKVTKPLKNHAFVLNKKRRQIFRIKYERLLDWCVVCAMISHLFTEHDD